MAPSLIDVTVVLVLTLGCVVKRLDSFLARRAKHRENKGISAAPVWLMVALKLQGWQTAKADCPISNQAKVGSCTKRRLPCRSFVLCW